MTPERTLADYCQELFLLGLQIQANAVQLPDCDSLRSRVLGLLQSIREQAPRAGHIPADVEEAQYAVTAFLDEVIKSSDWPDRNRWSTNPLQAQLFGESNAGVNFFEQRLPAVRRNSPAAVEVYYYCIMLGFEGKYRMGHPDELNGLIKDLRRDLGRGAGKLLSKHGARPDDASRGGRGLPLIPLAGVAIAIAVIVVIVLYLLLAESRGDAVELLQRLGRS